MMIKKGQGKEGGDALQALVRPGSLDVVGQQVELFPFDAFSFQKEGTESGRPEVTLKQPWKLNSEALEGYTIDPKAFTAGSFTHIDGGTDLGAEPDRTFNGGPFVTNVYTTEVYNDITGADFNGTDNERGTIIFEDGLLIRGPIKVKDGFLQSVNYVPGVSGTYIDLNAGDVEFNDGVFRGTVFATNGEFTGVVNATSGTFVDISISGQGSFNELLIADLAAGNIIIKAENSEVTTTGTGAGLTYYKNLQVAASGTVRVQFSAKRNNTNLTPICILSKVDLDGVASEIADVSADLTTVYQTFIYDVVLNEGDTFKLTATTVVGGIVDTRVSIKDFQVKSNRQPGFLSWLGASNTGTSDAGGITPR